MGTVPPKPRSPPPGANWTACDTLPSPPGSGPLPKAFPLILALLLASPSPAPAGGPGLDLRLGLSARTFDYEEFDERNASLDREEGRLPGVAAALGYRSGPWSLDAALQWSHGEADYRSPGATTVTDEEILDLELLAGRRLFGSEASSLHLLAGVGYRTWWRDIRSTASADGLDETYRWGYGLLGLRGAHVLDQCTLLTAELAMTRTIDPRIEVDFLRFYDDADLDLGIDNGFRARLVLERSLGPDISLSLMPWYERWKLGRSDDAVLTSGGTPIGRIHEPRSETRDYGVQVTLGWRFGG